MIEDAAEKDKLFPILLLLGHTPKITF